MASIVMAPAKAAPARLARRPSNRIRATRSRPHSCVAAKAFAIAAALVLLPTAATPIKSSRQRCAWRTTSPGSSSNARSRTNAGTEACRTTVVPRSPSAIRAPLDKTVRLQEGFRYLLGRFLVDVDAGVQLRHVVVVELGGKRIQRIGNLGVLVEDLLARDRRHVVWRGVILVVLQHDEVERRDAAVGGEHHG